MADYNVVFNKGVTSTPSHTSAGCVAHADKQRRDGACIRTKFVDSGFEKWLAILKADGWGQNSVLSHGERGESASSAEKPTKSKM